MTMKQLHDAYFPALYAIMKLSPADAAGQTYGQFYRAMKERTGFIIIDRERIVGAVTFSDLVEGSDVVIHALIHPDYHNRWITKSMCKIILHYPFSVLKATRISAPICVNFHPEAAKLVERLGFVEEGVLRKRLPVNGELYDIKLFGMLHEDLRW